MEALTAAWKLARRAETFAIRGTLFCSGGVDGRSGAGCAGLGFDVLRDEHLNTLIGNAGTSGKKEAFPFGTTKRIPGFGEGLVSSCLKPGF